MAAAALWAAAAPSWGVVRGVKPPPILAHPASAPPSAAVPRLAGPIALSAAFDPRTLAAPAGAPSAPPSVEALAPGLAPLGVPGPGIAPAHAEAVQRLADESGQAWFIHGSRQTGTRFSDGKPFLPESDLNLGVIGPPETLVERYRSRWDGVPDVRYGPMRSVPTVEEALGKGYLVFKPRVALPYADDVALLAAPLRTEHQLARLQRTPRAPGDRFRFTIIGDAEPGRFFIARALFGAHGVFWKLLRRADASGSDFILQLGDLVSRGIRRNFSRVFHGLRNARLSTPFLTVIGNHDRHKPHGVTNDRLYRRYWGATDWVLDRGDWRFITLDNSAGRVTDEQLRWLEKSLAVRKRLIVFTHIPPAPLGVFTDYGGLKGAGGFARGAEKFMELMSRHKVERVYMGHVHGLAAVTRDGVRYVLTGGGGSPLYPNNAVNLIHHSLEVEVGPGGIAETVHPLDGAPFRL